MAINKLASPTGIEPTYKTPLFRRFLRGSEHQKHPNRSSYRNKFVAANPSLDKEIPPHMYGSALMKSTTYGVVIKGI